MEPDRPSAAPPPPADPPSTLPDSPDADDAGGGGGVTRPPRPSSAAEREDGDALDVEPVRPPPVLAEAEPVPPAFLEAGDGAAERAGLADDRAVPEDEGLLGVDEAPEPASEELSPAAEPGGALLAGVPPVVDGSSRELLYATPPRASAAEIASTSGALLRLGGAIGGRGGPVPAAGW